MSPFVNFFIFPSQPPTPPTKPTAASAHTQTQGEISKQIHTERGEGKKERKEETKKAEKERKREGERKVRGKTVTEDLKNC